MEVYHDIKDGFKHELERVIRGLFRELHVIIVLR